MENPIEMDYHIYIYIINIYNIHIYIYTHILYIYVFIICVYIYISYVVGDGVYIKVCIENIHHIIYIYQNITQSISGVTVGKCGCGFAKAGSGSDSELQSPSPFRGEI